LVAVAIYESMTVYFELRVTGGGVGEVGWDRGLCTFLSIRDVLEEPVRLCF
jgi:hypothetical protein